MNGTYTTLALYPNADWAQHDSIIFGSRRAVNGPMITWVNNDLFESTAVIYSCQHAGAKNHVHKHKSWGVVYPSRRAEEWTECTTWHTTSCLWFILIFIACEFHQASIANRIEQTEKSSWFPHPCLSDWFYCIFWRPVTAVHFLNNSSPVWIGEVLQDWIATSAWSEDLHST